MAASVLFVASVLSGLAAAQMPGTAANNHPRLDTWQCSVADGCRQQSNLLVLDALSHWIHQKENTNLPCGEWGRAPNTTICPNAQTCQQNCVMEGISDYSAYGISTDGEALDIHFLREDGTPSSPRLYLLADGAKSYQMLNLAGNELTFTVDVSKLPCGMNGALSLSEMKADGGASTLNTAGPAYGTGYCDSQCSVTPFINGVGNIEGKGSCCNQLDVWKANSRATLTAPFTCNKEGQYLCSGDECGAQGVCDKSGCGMNPYVYGNKQFYGRGENFAIDTSRPFTVVTQFPLQDGVLREIHRTYVQDDKILQNPPVNVTGFSPLAFINDKYCIETGARRYVDLGATERIGEALKRGMVLIFSLWWDEGGFMNWLDSGDAGPCNATEGNPSVIRQVERDPSIRISSIRWGEIGSTF